MAQEDSLTNMAIEETPPTNAKVERGSVRFARTIEGDDVANPGLYLVVGEETHPVTFAPAWLCLVLSADHDLEDEERGGDMVVHADEWLRDWTEPYAG